MSILLYMYMAGIATGVLGKYILIGFIQFAGYQKIQK